MKREAAADLVEPGFKHHPQTFPNPTPIVDSILKVTESYIPVDNSL